MTPHQELAFARTYWLDLKARARADVNVFMGLVFRNDQELFHPPFQQQWFHREWQRMWLEEPLTVLHGATGFGKTEQMLGHCLWRMGRQPSIRIGIGGKKLDGQPLDRLRKIMRLIETVKVVLEIFPELEPGEPWNTDTLRLKHAGADTTTNTVNRYGVDSAVAGARLDLFFLDDVVDEESTLTEEQREKTITWVDASIQTRGTTRGQIHVLANAWHPKDMPHVVGARPGVVHKVYPAENPSSPGQGHDLLWPSFRPAEWLRSKLSTMTPTSYARMFLCRARDDATRVFQKSWFDAARKKGENVQPVYSVPEWRDEPTIQEVVSGAMLARRNRMRVVVGVDLATGKKERKKKSDLTVFFVLGVHMETGDKQVLWVEAGRWSGPESMRRLREIERRYHPERFVVEDNGAQEFFVQFVEHFPECNPRVEGFTTTGQKWDEALGIEGIGVEMAAGRWIIPGPPQLKGDDEDTKRANAQLLEDYLARLGPERDEGEDVDAYLARRTFVNLEARQAYAEIAIWADHLLDFIRGVHTPDRVMGSYFAKEGSLRLLGGLFQPLPALATVGTPHPASPAAEHARDVATVGHARNFNPPPAPPPIPPPIPAPPPAPVPVFRMPKA